MYRDDRGPPREMHSVTCAECGKETEVPFKSYLRLAFSFMLISVIYLMITLWIKPYNNI